MHNIVFLPLFRGYYVTILLPSFDLYNTVLVAKLCNRKTISIQFALNFLYYKNIISGKCMFQKCMKHSP